jgi:hypothetical protein
MPQTPRGSNRRKRERETRGKENVHVHKTSREKVNTKIPIKGIAKVLQYTFIVKCIVTCDNVQITWWRLRG